MLDIGYRSLRAFVRDCRKCNYNARLMLTVGDNTGYTLLPDGFVQANDYL